MHVQLYIRIIQFNYTIVLLYTLCQRIIFSHDATLPMYIRILNILSSRDATHYILFA